MPKKKAGKPKSKKAAPLPKWVREDMIVIDGELGAEGANINDEMWAITSLLDRLIDRQKSLGKRSHNLWNRMSDKYNLDPAKHIYGMRTIDDCRVVITVPKDC